MARRRLMRAAIVIALVACGLATAPAAQAACNPQAHNANATETAKLFVVAPNKADASTTFNYSCP